MTLSINDVCTHEDLVEEVGETEIARILPPVSGSSPEELSEGPRTRALRDVLRALSRRTPPIREADLSVPSELRDAVAYGALSALYRDAITTSGDRWAELHRHYRKLYQGEIDGMMLTLSGGERGPASLSIRMERG